MYTALNKNGFDQNSNYINQSILFFWAFIPTNLPLF